MNLITGGLGFNGNELVWQLSHAGEDVAMLDNRNRVASRIELDGLAVDSESQWTRFISNLFIGFPWATWIFLRKRRQWHAEPVS
jgi:nucleoside-diphosphate-sugar epimerase